MRWNIDLGKDKRTAQRTTQRGVRSCINPTISWRYPTNDRIIWYKCMPDPVFSNTLKSGTFSKIGNKYGQAYCTSYGWSICHPMAKKSEYHDTLSLVFKQDGVPTKMIVENSREQSLGKFERKCKEADCHIVSPLVTIVRGFHKRIEYTIFPTTVQDVFSETPVGSFD